MDIYIDVVFLINFFMNGFIFLVVRGLIKSSVKLYRVLFGAFVSALLYCIMLIVFTRYFNFITAILMLVAGLFVSFGKMPLKKFGITILYAHIVAFLTGGVAIGLYHYINTINFRGVIQNFSIPLLIVSSLFCFVILKGVSLYVRARLMTKRMYHQIKVYQGESDLSINALVDTGNALTEPISGYGVLLIEQKILEQMIEKEKLMDKMRTIPFKSVGGEGIIFGFIPDKIEIQQEKGVMVVTEVVIGLCHFTLSKKGDYQGLIGPNFFEEAGGLSEKTKSLAG